MSLAIELRVKELLREKGWTTRVLAEKTGMSESYLTHIKNGTRRWNEDSLKKLATAFEMNPSDLFAQRKNRTDNLESNVSLPAALDVSLRLSVIPVLGDLPSNPSPFNNQIMQATTGFKDVFFPVLNVEDSSMFALSITHNHFAPFCNKNDLLVISPESWVKTGEIAAIEYGNQQLTKSIVRVFYDEQYIILSPLSLKDNPVVLVRGKDYFRSIGKVLQKVSDFA